MTRNLGRPKGLRYACLALGLLGVVVPGFSRANARAQQRPPAFRSNVELIYVNVIVRDRDNNVVRGLKREDFAIVEDNKPQTITTFDFEEVRADAIVAAAEPPGPVQAILKAPAATAKPAAPKPEPAPAAAASAPIDLNDRRLIVLLFDTSSMQPEEVERAVASAREYVDKRATPADLIAVASVSSSLQVDQDFTGDLDKVRLILDRYAGVDTAGFEEGAVPAEEVDPSEGFIADETEFNIFNTDRRLQAIELLADAMAPIQQKKSIVYFSGGMSRTGEDNQVQLRSAIDRAVKANVSIYPVDTRGLTAIVPGGDASRGSGRGTALFSGRGMSQQFERQAASQDTLVTLASDTGGRAFLDTNDFGGVFTKVIADTSAYYLLGYSSTNPARDGRFRRIRVTIKKPGLRIEHRNGYYADRDFAHSTRDDRERQLQEQMFADLSSTDLTVWVSSSFFRMADDRFYVPVSVAVPGSQIPAAAAGTQPRPATVDVFGLVRDELQRPVGRIRETVRLTAEQAQDVRRKSMQYNSGFTLPPGKYKLKFVLRENQNGTLGSFESDITVPDLKRAPVKVSSVLLGTQIQKAGPRDTASPLARDGTLLVPSLTHVVSTKQPLYFYFEVYEPSSQSGSPRVLSSISFFRGRVRTYETPLVEMTRLTAPDRKAAIFQLAVPPAALKPGLYTCQVTIVDDVAGTFAFPRLPLLVRQ